MKTFGLSSAQQARCGRGGEPVSHCGRSRVGWGIKRPATVLMFVASTGGVCRPARQRDGRHLTAAEREEISRSVAAGQGCRALARHPCPAISRELARMSSYE